MEKYILTKQEKTNGEKIYFVNGEKIRTSKRDYIACSIDGRYFFSRLDLIGKGDSRNNTKPIAYLDTTKAN